MTNSSQSKYVASDPRGPVRTITAIEATPSATLLTKDCGHIGSHAQHFSYRVGDTCRCFECGQDGGAVQDLKQKLPRAWEDGKPNGQCAITALVVQDVFGGELLRGIACGESHYWNRLPDGSELDLTREQFPQFSVCDIVTRTREYVLSFPKTVLRYEQLKRNLKI